MSEREIGRALPSILYGDPAETLDRIREMNDRAERKAKRKAALERKHKSMRIQASVRKAMRDGGDKHGKR